MRLMDIYKRRKRRFLVLCGRGGALFFSRLCFCFGLGGCLCLQYWSYSLLSFSLLSRR